MAVRLSESAKELIRSSFFGKDFETYVNEINGYIEFEFGPEVASNIVASEQGQMLVEAYAFGLSTLSWYGDRQSDDTHLFYVRLRSAAVVIARQLGYKPSAAVPPATTLTITLSFAPTSTRLTIEKGRRLIGPGGLIFVTIEELIFDVGEVGPKTVDVIEGEVIEEIYTSDGTANQFFEIETIPDGKSIAQDTPRAFINDIEWTENPLLTFERTDQFEVQYGFNPPRLQFGNGVAGNIPPIEAEIRLEFVATSGPAGFVQANTIEAFEEPLVAGTETLAATLSHPTSTPGSNRESIDSIKINAPQVTQAADRAVTQADLDGLINAFTDATFGSVAIGRATVPRSVDQDAEALSIIAEIESSCPLTLVYSGAVGTFVAGDVITATGGATGVVVGVTATSLSVLSLGTGSFSVGESITASGGATSGATATVTSSSLSTTSTRLRTYWDTVLASNCQANVVIAQILAADTVGRYITAPEGLAQALNTSLDAQAESTVKVQVTDGSVNLISVDLDVEISVLSAFDNIVQRQSIENAAVAALEDILLGRSYGQSLRISDLYVVVDSLEGVDFSHISITGDATAISRVNSFGDLVIETFEVITLGVSPVVSFI